MAQVHIPRELRRQVIGRAGGRCEYCLISEESSPFAHHVDHIIAIKHGGQTVSGNLALACMACNRSKGSDLSGLDPETGALVPLFHPRVQHWEEHFVVDGVLILGRTETGRATVALLHINDPQRLELRQALVDAGQALTLPPRGR